GVVQDRVEAGGVAVAGVAVAGGVQCRGAEPHPVPVVGQLQRRHPGVDILRLAGPRVVGVAADHPVHGVRDVVAVDVAVPGPADVDRVDLVGPRRARRCQPAGGGRVARVVVVVQAHLGGGAGGGEGLAVAGGTG